MYFFDLFYSSFCDLCFLIFPAFSEKGSYRSTSMFFYNREAESQPVLNKWSKMTTEKWKIL